MSNKKYSTSIPPDVLKEWDFKKNKNIDPDKVTPGLSKKVWWVCRKCGHNWQTRISHKINGSGCPACSGKVVSTKNSLYLLFPELVKEWDYTTNKKLPEEYSYGSHVKVGWVCKKCRHRWNTSIKNRTMRKSKCPECSKTKRSKTFITNKINKKGSLLKTHPKLCKEWCYSKNTCLTPKEVTYGSDKKVWWKCLRCDYVWKTRINSRTGKNKSSCPACSGKALTDKNRFSTLFPSLMQEWDFEKNKINPKDIPYASNKKIWWICSKCLYEWKACLHNRTRKINPRQCPKCAEGNVSKISQVWLDSLNNPAIKREYFIKDLGFRVDGYDPKTNTVYEFFGDYWHGNPDVYSTTAINKRNKKSFGFLYKKTIERISILKENGFKVIFIWEKNFKNMEHLCNL